MLPLEPKDKNKVTPSDEPLLTNGPSSSDNSIKQADSSAATAGSDTAEPTQYTSPPEFASFEELVKIEEQKDAAAGSGATESTDVSNASSAPENTSPAVSPLPATIFAGEEKKSGPKKKKIIIGAIVATLIVLFGATIAAYAYFNSTDKVLGDALTKAAMAESLNTKGTYTYNSKKSGDGDVKMDFDVKAGTNDWVQADITTNVTDIERPFSVDTSFIFAAQEDVYFKISNVKDLILAIFSDGSESSDAMIEQFLSPIAAKVDDKWIKIPKEDLNDTSPEAAEVDECAAKVDEEMKSNPELIKQVRKIYDEHSFLVVSEKLPSEAINGVESLHYKLKVDEAKFKAFKEAFKGSELYKKLKDCAKNDEAYTFDDGFFGDFSKTNFEVWVSKWSHEFTRIAASGNTDDGSYSITFDPIFNKPVNIELPKESTPIKQILEEIQELFFGGMEMEPQFEDESPAASSNSRLN